MIRRSLVLLMVLLTVALLTPKGALAARHGDASYKAKVFASNSSGTISVSATFNCLIPASGSSSLSGSFFYQLADGSSVYGDITTILNMPPPTCSLSTSTMPISGTASGPVKVESRFGNGATGTITFVFQNAKNGHNFTPGCNCVINLMLSDLTITSNTMTTTICGFNNPESPPCTFIAESSATLLLSVGG